MTGAIEKLLTETIGLDSASVGPTVVRQAVRERMAACRKPTLRPIGNT